MIKRTMNENNIEKLQFVPTFGKGNAIRGFCKNKLIPRAGDGNKV